MGIVLYKNLSKYYDKIYDSKNYKEEAVELRMIIRKYKKSKGKMLLDIACGTGQHLQYLKPYFYCTGLDESKDMLSIARKRNPDIRFYQKNMLEFNLTTKFDVITCLFSSIGHLKTLTSTQRALNNMAKHLNEDGLLILEPFLEPDQILNGYPDLTIYQDENLKIARLSYTRVRKRVAAIDFQYCISEKKRGIRYDKERVEMSLIKRDELLAMARRANLRANYIQTKKMTGRGVLIGTKN